MVLRWTKHNGSALRKWRWCLNPVHDFFCPQYHNVGSFHFTQDQKNSVFSVLSHRLFTYYKVILDVQYVGFVGSLQDLNATGTRESWATFHVSDLKLIFFFHFVCWDPEQLPVPPLLQEIMKWELFDCFLN